MITKEEVIKISKLARLELTEKEIEKMQKDLSGVLDYFNSLKKAKPRSEAAASTTGVKNGKEVPGLLKKEKVMRKDEAKPQSEEIPRKLIGAFPDKKENYIKVNPIRNDWG